MFINTAEYVQQPIRQTDNTYSQPRQTGFAVKDLSFRYHPGGYTEPEPETDLYKPVFEETRPRPRQPRRETEYHQDAAFYVGMFNGIAPTVLGKLTDRSPEVYKLTEEEKERIIEDTVPVIKKYEGRGRVDPVTGLLMTIGTIMGGKYMFSKPDPKPLPGTGYTPPPMAAAPPAQPQSATPEPEQTAEMDDDELQAIQDL